MTVNDVAISWKVPALSRGALSYIKIREDSREEKLKYSKYLKSYNEKHPGSNLEKAITGECEAASTAINNLWSAFFDSSHSMFCGDASNLQAMIDFCNSTTPVVDLALTKKQIESYEEYNSYSIRSYYDDSNYWSSERMKYYLSKGISEILKENPSALSARVEPPSLKRRKASEVIWKASPYGVNRLLATSTWASGTFTGALISLATHNNAFGILSITAFVSSLLAGSIAEHRVSKIKKQSAATLIPLSFTNASKFLLMKKLISNLTNVAETVPKELNIFDSAIMDQTSLAAEMLLARRQKLSEAIEEFSSNGVPAYDSDLVSAGKALVMLENEWDALHERLAGFYKAMDVLSSQTKLVIARRKLQTEIDQVMGTIVNGAVASEFIEQAKLAQEALVDAIAGLKENQLLAF